MRMEGVVEHWLGNIGQPAQAFASGPEVFICSIVILLSGVLCSAAGIGGGTVYVVVLMIVGKLSAVDAVPMSKVIVCFGSVASLVVNVRKWSRQPVVDLHVCRVVVPPALMGTLLGVHFNWHANEVIIVGSLAALMLCLTLTVFYLACQQRREEAACSMSGLPSIEASSRQEQGNPQDAEITSRHALSKQSVDAWDILHSCSLLLLVVLGQVLHFQLQECSSNGGRCSGSLAVPLLVWRSNATVVLVMQRMALSFPFMSCTLVGVYQGYLAETEAGWDLMTIVKYQLISVATGFVAGFAGIGGGVVLSPFFLLMGLEPAVAVGTSSTCVLYTSLSTATQYLFLGRVKVSLAVPYGVMSIISAAMGTVLVHGIQSRYGSRRSFITFIVVAGLALATGLTGSKLSELVRSQQQ